LARTNSSLLMQSMPWGMQRNCISSIDTITRRLTSTRRGS
jgi:hypothetical protein